MEKEVSVITARAFSLTDVFNPLTLALKYDYLNCPPALSIISVGPVFDHPNDFFIG